MRIVAGDHRGRVLKTPVGNDIRPTSDKIRQALFNALQHRGAVVDAKVLDAFCGTGALALEAYSQGATSCVFMDIAAGSLALARENAALLKADGVSWFLKKDATHPGVRPDDIPLATLLFLDPPYHKNLVPQALVALKSSGWLDSDGCFVVAEAEKAADLSNLEGEILFDKTYRETRVLILQI